MSNSMSLHLVATQIGSARDRDLFFRCYREWLERTARRLSHYFGVPVQDHLDVQQEWALRILDPEVRRYEPSRATAKSYLIGLLKNVIDHRGLARLRARQPLPSSRVLETLVEDEVSEDLVEQIGSWRSTEAMEARLALEAILRGEDEVLVRALYRVYWHGETARAVAAEFALEESKFSRMMTHFRERAWVRMAA